MERLISAIVTVYNRADMIAAAIASLRLQGPDRIEIIVVDDGSTDGTAEVVEGLGDPQVRLIRHGGNRGIPAARNSGLDAADGDYVAWLDSDDVARPDRLAHQLRFLDANPDVAMIGGCAGLLTANGRGRRGARVPLLSHEDIRAQLLFRSAFQQSSIMGRTAILKQYRYRAAFPVCEDVDMFVRLSDDHRVANLPHILVDRRLHAGQTVHRESAAIVERKAAIFRPLLARLGIDADEEDLRRHILIGNLKKQPVSRDLLDWSEQWLTRINAANRTARPYDPAALAFVTARVWLRVARKAMRGPARRHALVRIARSPLGAGLLNRNGRAWLRDALRVRMQRG